MSNSLWGGEHCDLYRPGHLVHVIQAAHSCWEPRTPRRGRVVGHGDITVSVDFDGELLTYANHTVHRIAQLVEVLGPLVTVDEGWSILKIVGKGQQLCFSVARSGCAWTPCPAAGLAALGVSTLGEVAVLNPGEDGRLVIGDPRE